MLHIPARNLKHLTDIQMQHLGPKSFNILTRKLKIYEDQKQLYEASKGCRSFVCVIILFLNILRI